MLTAGPRSAAGTAASMPTLWAGRCRAQPNVYYWIPGSTNTACGQNVLLRGFFYGYFLEGICKKYVFCFFREQPCLETPRNAWCGWDLGDPGPSQPSTLPRTLSRAHKMTVATVIAGQVMPIRTTVEQPLDFTPHLRRAR